MENASKVHHEVRTKANNKVFNQGVVHIMTLEYCVAKRDYAGEVDKEQRTGIVPANRA